jgi:hypothetical protein
MLNSKTSIAQSVEEILEQHLQQSIIRQLFNIGSDVQSLKKSKEKLQKLLEALRVSFLAFYTRRLKTKTGGYDPPP